jgi:hypothetical protein
LNKRLVTILLMLSILVGIGCTPEPEIVRHRVHKDRSGLEKLRQPDQPPVVHSPSMSEPKSEKTRMAVAIFNKTDATWFFKIVGPPEKIDAAEQQWRPFFESVKFEDKEPTWDLPEGWSAAGPKPMRFATFVIDDAPPSLELAISSLGPNQDMLDNVNRWRKQIGLKDIAESELDDNLKKHKTETGEFLLFDALGTGPGRMTPPFAGGGVAPFASGGAAPFAGGGGQPVGPTEKLEYDLPDGWTKLDSSMMVPVRLQKEVGDGKAQITIVELPADANEWEPNVIRWANQVSMGGLSKQQFAARTTDLKIDGVEGKQVDLIDLESESKTGMIGGMVKREGSAWFLKLTGNKQIVEDSREAFEQFSQSIRFK